MKAFNWVYGCKELESVIQSKGVKGMAAGTAEGCRPDLWSGSRAHSGNAPHTSGKATPPNPSQIVPPIGDQAFKSSKYQPMGAVLNQTTTVTKELAKPA